MYIIMCCSLLLTYRFSSKGIRSVSTNTICCTLLKSFTAPSFKHQVANHFKSSPHTGNIVSFKRDKKKKKTAAQSSNKWLGVVLNEKQKSKHSNPQEPNQAEAGAVLVLVAKATERVRESEWVFENNPSATAAGWSAVDCKLTQPRVAAPYLHILLC